MSDLSPFLSLSMSRRALLLVGAFSLGLTGCSFLKPSGVTPRSFLLAPAAAPSPATTNPATASVATKSLAIGMRPVNLPAYLLRKSIAVRQHTNEIVYLENAVWAERLDLGLQRVLGVSLGASLAIDQVRFSAWRPEEVAFEVHVTVEQFDVDATGDAVLAAWWRLLSPGGEKMLASGRFSTTRQGQSPLNDPQAAVTLMSALADDFAQVLSSEARRRQR